MWQKLQVIWSLGEIYIIFKIDFLSSPQIAPDIFLYYFKDISKAFFLKGFLVDVVKHFCAKLKLG